MISLIELSRTEGSLSENNRTKTLVTSTLECVHGLHISAVPAQCTALERSADIPEDTHFFPSSRATLSVTSLDLETGAVMLSARASL